MSDLVSRLCFLSGSMIVSGGIVHRKAIRSDLVGPFSQQMNEGEKELERWRLGTGWIREERADSLGCISLVLQIRIIMNRCVFAYYKPPTCIG